MKNSEFDLLSLVEYGGCSAKLAPKELSALLSDIPLLKNSNVLVDIESHDDAGVYKISDDMALVVTTDFFPPVCSDAYDFGRVAAANSLSDVYAMGGIPLLTLNLTMFPSQSVSLEVLKNILLGGQHKVDESGAFTMGGHTIDDEVPKYGLAVVGTVHPERVITNCGARVGQKLILTKPLGTGVIISARRLELCSDESYFEAIEQMAQLNDKGAEIMRKYGVRGATDVTGFGLMGHAVKMAQGSGVTIKLYADSLPAIDGVEELIDMGCLPGAIFRNLEYCGQSVEFSSRCSTYAKMLTADAQTSGGLLMAIDSDKAQAALEDIKAYHPKAAIIGEVIAQKECLLEI